MSTTPPPEDRPDGETSATPASSADAGAPTEQLGPTPTTEPASHPIAGEGGPGGFRPPPGYAPPPGFPPPPGYGYPFAPVARAPRIPWINPQRRGAIIGTAIGGALVVLLAGIGIGYAVAPDHHHGDYRMHHPYGGNRGGMGVVPVPGNGRLPNRHLPGQLPVRPQQPSNAPSAPTAPSSSPTK